MDKQKLIAEIVQRFDVKLDHDDPAFILVELNRLVLEDSAQKIANQITQAADKLDGLTTRRVDDVISIANETLSKFAQKTNELKKTINSLQPPLSSEQPKLEQNTAIDQQINQRLWWTLPSMFVIGVMIGAGLAFLALK
jgi:hypothetical protein